MSYDAKDKLVMQSEALKTGDKLRTRLHHGELISTVVQINKTTNKTSEL